MKIIRIITIIVCIVVIIGLYFAKNHNEKTKSPARNQVERIENENTSIENKILSGKPVIIDFGAEWCGPCKEFHPLIEKMQEKYKDKISIEYVDIDSNGDLALKYPVEAIPCQVFFVNGKAYESKNIKTELISVTKNGEKITYHIGGIPEEEFEAIIKDMIGE